MLPLLLISVCWQLASSQYASPPGPEVALRQGTYTPNTSVATVDQFLSIPFAAPPVGQLRFANPQPYTSGSPKKRFKATTYGPGCPQGRSPPRYNGYAEDCLTLDVLRPVGARSRWTKLPVLVWIYGGSEIAGQSILYNGTKLVDYSASTRRPIIFVALNYRTGGFGLSVNSLFAKEGILNVAIKDQYAGLEWVHSNIAAFGGDPKKVVIFGESAGSFNAWMQMRYAAVKKESGRLFQGAIAESGAPASLLLKGLEPSSGDAYFQQTLDATGCGDAADKLSCLRDVPYENLTQVWFNSSSPLEQNIDDYGNLQVGFGIDGQLVKSENYWDHEIAPIPLIHGTNLNEGSLGNRVSAGTADNRTYLAGLVAKDLNTTNTDLIDPIVDTYYSCSASDNGRGYNADPSADSSYYAGEAVYTDLAMDFPRRVWVGLHSKRAATWSYIWKQAPPLATFLDPWFPFKADEFDEGTLRGLGVSHASELGYVYGTVRDAENRTRGDVALANTVQSMWISFAYSLDPNKHGLKDVADWQKYDTNKAKVMAFENQGPYRPSMQPDSLRLESYNAYKSANDALKLPKFPRIRV
ncbi:Alpha/Beta hydrolase protein [Phyllosticta citrichinensis]|uniref:Carboxylic ester hydrolase n=1 Tax=Phyllosticta citrichinensis TaxID=1130410 RepID=A0ABR1XSH9_9PEZI